MNAIYFKGDWHKKFNPGKTRDRDFYVTPTNVIQVPTMHEKINANFCYSPDLKSDVLELPYKGKNLSMLVILPRLDQTSLQNVERDLSAAALASLRLHSHDLNVYLPKFKMEPSFVLNEKLQQLGIRALFDEGRADLSGINGGRDLYVSSVVHKAFIEVNEEGSEAAAATAVITLTRSSMITPEFKADHPFIFLIRDTTTKTILFLGKFISP